MKIYTNGRVIFLWAMCWLPVLLWAQGKVLPQGFEYFSGSDGLSDKTITAISQDQRGFLWIGTPSGLHRFDGYHFKLFQHHPFDTTSLSSNYITVLCEDQCGTLWVGTREGLNRYNPQAGAFTRIGYHSRSVEGLSSNAITAIAGQKSSGTDGAQILWVATNQGLNRLEINAPDNAAPAVAIARLPLVQGIAPGTIRNMIIDKRGLLWISTANAVYHSTSSYVLGKLFLLEKVPATLIPRGTLPTNQHCTFIVDPSQTLWIVTGKAIVRVGQAENSGLNFQSFAYPGNIEMADPENVALDWRRKIFLLSIKSAPLTFDTRTLAFEFLGKHYAQLTDNFHCTRVFCDRSRNIWFGTKGSGLLKYHLANDYFKATSDLENDLPSDALPSPNFGRGIIDRSGRLWYPHEDGLASISPSGKTQKIYSHNPLDTNSLSHNQVTVVLTDPVSPERFLWVGTAGGGLNRFDRKTNRFIHYSGNDGFLNSAITGILPDNKGNLWVGTHHGISRLSLNREREVVHFQNFSQNDKWQGDAFSVSRCFKTEQGQLCFGDDKRWVWFHPDSLTGDQPPPPVVITDFRIHHRLVSHRDPGSPLSCPISEVKEIALQHTQNTLGFTFAALNFATPSGNRYAYRLENFDADWNDAGNDHQAIYTNLPPGTYKLKVRVCNEEGIWSEEAAELVIVIRPPWWQHWGVYLVFGLLVAALMWNIRRQRQLRMEAAMERVRVEEKRRQAEHLEAKAKELSTAFLALKEKNEEVISIQQKLIAQDRLATLGHLVAGIAHEIKNPLNFVANFSDIAAEQAEELSAELEKLRPHIEPETFENLQLLIADIRENTVDTRENSQRAISIIHNLMDLSRDTEHNFQKVDLHVLLDENIKLAYHGFRAIEPGFNVTIQKMYVPDLPLVEVIPSDLGRALLNLLNNACYALHEKQLETKAPYEPILQISTHLEPQAVQIRILDNGIGMPPDILEKVFTPFFTTKPNGKGNAGLGLSITHEILINKLGGKLEVRSESGVFTEFRITIPKKHVQE